MMISNVKSFNKVDGGNLHFKKRNLRTKIPFTFPAILTVTLIGFSLAKPHIFQEYEFEDKLVWR